jgi:SNW domain-containing protein 1
MGLYSGERDISEKIALGLAQPSASRESMFDSRLFNQSAGLGSGFASEDAYNLYDKPLFTGSSSASIYRPKKAGGDPEDVMSIPGVRSDRIEKIVDGSSKAPHKGFQGAETGSGSRDGPVQFEKEMDEADPFGLEQFMTSAKRGRAEKEEASKDRGSMMAS